MPGISAGSGVLRCVIVMAGPQGDMTAAAATRRDLGIESLDARHSATAWLYTTADLALNCVEPEADGDVCKQGDV